MIWADGYKRIGMGHIYEMLTVAKYLKEQYGYEIVFITRNNRAALDLIYKHQIRVLPLKYNSSRQEELDRLKHIFAFEKPNIIIVNVLKRVHEKAFMKKLRSFSKATVIAITRANKKCLVEADIVVHLSFFQEKDNYKHIRKTKYYVGPEYVILSADYLSIKNRLRIKNKVERVMVCMGGTDHHNLTLEVLKTIDKSSHEFCCDVVLSSSFFEKEAVDDVVKKLHHKINVYYDIDGICDRLLLADMAITSGGNAHIERMCAGVPGVVISQLLHQAVSAKKVSEFGATLDLGLYKNVNPESFLEAFDRLLENKDWRERMSKRGRLLIDGKGLSRLSEIISRGCKGESTSKNSCVKEEFKHAIS